MKICLSQILSEWISLGRRRIRLMSNYMVRVLTKNTIVSDEEGVQHLLGDDYPGKRSDRCGHIWVLCGDRKEVLAE